MEEIYIVPSLIWSYIARKVLERQYFIELIPIFVSSALIFLKICQFLLQILPIQLKTSSKMGIFMWLHINIIGL